MELRSVSTARIYSKLCPDRLNEPFNEPVTPELIKGAVNIGIYGDRNHSCHNSCTSDASGCKNKEYK